MNDIHHGGTCHCTFAVVHKDREAVTIVDLNIGKSVTNDAAYVVEQLRAAKVLKPGWLKESFVSDHTRSTDRPQGPTIWEQRIAIFLWWHRQSVEGKT